MKTHPNRIRQVLRIVCPMLLLLVMGVGCVMQWRHEYRSSSFNLEATSGTDWPDKERMLLRYQIRDREAALESERMVLVFHGLSPEQQRLFHFQKPQQAVQIAGPGNSSLAVTHAYGKQLITFRSDYSEGTNTLEFGGQRVQLTQEGHLLLVGQQAINLSEGWKVIHLKGDHIWVE